MKKILLLTAINLCLAVLGVLPAQNNTRPNIFLPAATGMQVNSYTGALYYERQDLFVPGRGLNIDFTFSYSSAFDTTDWGYGYGWTHTYNMNYSLKGDSLTLVKSDGRRDVFLKNGSVYTAPVGVFDLLEEYEPGKLRLSNKYGMKYFFEDAANRKLTKMEDRNGNTITLTWTGTQLTALTDASGRQITLSWSGGHLSGITDALASPSRSWTYAYDQGNLVLVTYPLGAQVQYAYDTAHRLTRMTDEKTNETAVEYFDAGAVKMVAGCLTRHTFTYNLDQGKSYVTEVVGSGTQVTTYEFDAQGRNIARKGNCCGFQTSFLYDAANNITKTTDANDNSTTYAYDPKGNATSIADPEGCTVQMTYDPAFNQTASFRDKNGNLSTFTYDNKGNLTGIARPLAVSETYTYDTYGNQTGHTDGRGNTTTYEYNANGYLTKINHPVGGFSTQFTYDNRGNKLTQTDGNGHITHFKYDARNRVTEIEDPLGHKTFLEYDARGNKTKTTNALNVSTEYQYDQLDRLIQVNAPLGTFTRYTYDSRGNRLSETDQRGSTTTSSYDSRNFMIAHKDALGNETTYGYDANGNQIFVTDPLNHTTQYFYDKLNRLVKTKDPLGFETNYAFDCNGNTLTVTDANGNTTGYTYDALNRQTVMTDAMAFATHFEYDKNSNLTKITDAKGNPTAYEYDALNRKTKETFADNTTKIFTYDGAGNVGSRKDNAGNMTFYTYDANNRLTLRDYPDANDDHFTYDALGRMTEATNQNAVVTFAYDALNRMLGETLNGKTTGYAYNTVSGKRTLIYPSGRVIEEFYDARNQLSAIKESNETLASFAYDPAGRMTARNYGNGTVTTYTYDADNRVTAIVANPDSFINFRYAYDNVGNKLYEEKKHHPTHSEAYGYDANYRLINFKVGQVLGGAIIDPTIQIEYTYDQAGNRSTVATNGGTQNYISNNLNQYVEINGAFNQSLQYDLNGNLSTKGSISYVYNFDNQLTKVFSNINKENKYDAFGRLISIADTDSVLLYYAGANIVESLTSNIVKSYVYGTDIDDIILSIEQANSFYYYNQIGSVIACSIEPNGSYERFEYDAFGAPTALDGNFNITGNIPKKTLFTGRILLGDSIYYFRNRCYIPDLGRFNQRDKLSTPTLENAYTYCNNDPINNIDPLGLLFIKKIRKWVRKGWKKAGEKIEDKIKEGIEDVVINKFCQNVSDCSTCCIFLTTSKIITNNTIEIASDAPICLIGIPGLVGCLGMIAYDIYSEAQELIEMPEDCNKTCKKCSALPPPPYHLPNNFPPVSSVPAPNPFHSGCPLNKPCIGPSHNF